MVGDDPAGQVLPNAEEKLTTPSVVYFGEDGTATVGERAKAELERDPGRVVTLVKRDMGRDNYTVEAAGGRWYPQQVSAVILRKVVEDALAHLGHPLPAEGPIADAVITVPAYFGHAERKATVDAGKLAGLNVMEIVNEPTAAAVAHGLRGAAGGRTVLVYDLGGGTFDVTIVRMLPGEVRVVATGGDARLGGADWDRRLANLVLDKLGEIDPDADPRTDAGLMAQLVLQVEAVKIALSRREVSRFRVRTKQGPSDLITVSRDEYEEATEDLLERTIDFTRDLLGKALHKGVAAIDDLLLVGGMTRSPAVARRIAAAFPDLPAARPPGDAEHMVANGAARMAARAAHGPARAAHGPVRAEQPGENIPSVVNVTSKGYGVVVVRNVDRPRDGKMLSWMIEPNTEVPTQRHDLLYTVYDNQRRVTIQVYESMTDVLTDNVVDHVRLVEGDLVGLPAGLRKGHEVTLDVELGTDGILRIRAHEANGATLRLEAKVSGELAQEDMDTPLPGIRR
jgi:molecular chaperone DnaK